jgi:hypothetical protein
VREPYIDDDEVDSPDGGDEDGEGAVNRTHGPIIAAA